MPAFFIAYTALKFVLFKHISSETLATGPDFYWYGKKRQIDCMSLFIFTSLTAVQIYDFYIFTTVDCMSLIN